MDKKTKLWIIIAIILILVGYIIFCWVMNKLNWDFTKLSISVFETNKHEISDNFEDINVITNTADIEFMPSSNSNTLIVCYEQKNVSHSVKVEDNALIIEVNDTRKWYEHISVFVKTPKITIYLPEIEYNELKVNSNTGDISILKNLKFSNVDISVDTGNIINYALVHNDLKLKTSTGAILIKNTTANMIELSTSTGKVDVINVNCQSNIKIDVSTGKTNITNTNCKNIISNGSTGDISLKNVFASESFSIKRSTGDVKFEDCDANDIYVNTNTGNVKGNFLTNKVFFVQTDTGNIDVPKVMADEKCEIITDTGDIKITIG